MPDESLSLRPKNQVKIHQQVAGDHKAAEVAHKLLGVRVGHKGWEADHCVEHKHDNRFIQKFSPPLGRSAVWDFARNDDSCDDRESLQHDLENEVVSQYNHDYGHQESPDQEEHRVQERDPTWVGPQVLKNGFVLFHYISHFLSIVPVTANMNQDEQRIDN